MLESQGGEGNYAFFKLILLSLSKCLIVLGIDVLKICIVKKYLYFQFCMFKKLFLNTPLSLQKKNYFIFINFNIYLVNQSTIYLTRGLFTYIKTYTATCTKYYLYYYWRSFPYLGSLFFLFKNAPTLLSLSRDKTKVVAILGFLFKGVNNGGAMNLLTGEAWVKKKMIIDNTTILYNNLKKNILTFERSLRQQLLHA